MVPVSLELRVCCEVTNCPSTMVNDVDQAEEEIANKATAYTVTDNFQITFCFLSSEGMATLSI